MKIDSILRGFSTQNDANGNEGYFQSFSDPSEAWEVMRGEWDESAPDQERDIAILDDDTFPVMIKKRAIVIAAMYLIGKLDKQTHDDALYVSKYTSYLLLDFNFFYYSSFGRRFYTYREGKTYIWSDRQWQIFKELSAIHDFKGICKEAIKTAKDLKKKFGDKLTEEIIVKFVNSDDFLCAN